MVLKAHKVQQVPKVQQVQPGNQELVVHKAHKVQLELAVGMQMETA